MTEGKELGVIFYETSNREQPALDWLRTIKDRKARQRIQVRIARLRAGTFGDVKSVGDGVHELRVFEGKGYRLYFANAEDVLIILLNGGDKASKSQQQRDIERAKEYWNDYKTRNK